MRLLILMAIALSCQAAHAEVFKCIGKDGKTVYQAKPCLTSDKSKQLDIQTDQAQEEAAKAKLEAIQNEYDAKQAAKQEAERRDAALKNQTESTNALKQSAAAQQQQAIAEQRQAEALERQSQQNNNRVMIVAPPTGLPVMPPPVNRDILR